MINKSYIGAVTLAVFVFTPLFGQVHEHGAANLEISVSGNTVQVDLTIPAADVVGFEHAPENERQRSFIEETIAEIEALQDELFVFRTRRGATVTLVDFEVENPHDDHHDHDEDHHHDEDDHDEDHHHDEDDHDEDHHHDEDDHDEDHDHDDDHHDEDHDHDHEHGEVHSDFVIEARFSASDWERIRDLSPRGVFELFPSLTEIDWVLLTPAGQSAGEATSRRPRIPFR